MLCILKPYVCIIDQIIVMYVCYGLLSVNGTYFNVNNLSIVQYPEEKVTIDNIKAVMEHIRLNQQRVGMYANYLVVTSNIRKCANT